MMRLQLGAETPEYMLELSAFEAIQKLVFAQTFPKDLVLEGDYVRYVPGSVDIGKISHGLYLEDVLETGGKLLFFWRDEDFYRLEEVNPETGETTALWEDTASQGSPWDSLSLENARYGQFDYRITRPYGDLPEQRESHSIAAI